MSKLRDDLLPVFDQAVGIIDSLGLQRFTVAVRTRTWKTSIGDASGGYTDAVTAITPNPTVTMLSPYAAQMMGLVGAEGAFIDRFYKIEDITPAYTDATTGISGGYTPQQLTPYVAPGVDNVEVHYVLTGDDGASFECFYAAEDFSDSFEYKLIVRRKRREHESATAP